MIDPELEIQELLHLPVNLFKAFYAIYYDWSVGKITSHQAMDKGNQVLTDRSEYDLSEDEKKYIQNLLYPIYQEYKKTRIKASDEIVHN